MRMGRRAGMSKKPYTKKMLDEFDHLTMLECSQDQLERITGRNGIRRFINEHGRDICDLMFAELKKRDEASK
jgi:hypothetical protein